MKFNAFLFILLFSINWTNAQDCPTGDLIFGTQEEVDNFIIDYPNCTNIDGNLTITGPIYNLQGLNLIETIGNSLLIIDNHSLQNLEGLDNLTSIGGNFEIEDALQLTSTVGMPNLTTIGADWLIISNGELLTIDGFDNLESVGAKMEVRNNHELTSILGLPNLTIIGANGSGRLRIQTNYSLVNIDGFASLEIINGTCQVSGDIVHTVVGNLHTIKGNLEISAPLEDLNLFSNLITIDRGGVGATLLKLARIKVTDLSGFSNLEDYDQSLFISSTSLTSINGLQNIEKLSGLTFKWNTELNNLDALSNLDTISFAFYMEENGFVDFQGLENLKYIGQTLTIEEHSELTSVAAFENLNSVGGLKLQDNPLLQSLEGFENLTVVPGTISISENPSLPSLEGLGNLQRCDVLTITENSGLSNLTGLESLTTVENSLSISRNENLLNLNGCNLEVIRSLFISGNPLLNDISNLDNVEGLSGSLNISDNDELSQLADFYNIDSLVVLTISDNAILENLEGLNNLQYCYHLEIERNESIVNLDELSNLQLVAQRVYIVGNLMLDNITGLSNLYFGDRLRIVENPVLQNLDGLENIFTLNNLEIIDNPMLQNLQGLNGLQFNLGNFIFHGNDLIQNFNDLSSFSELHGNLSIQNNLQLQTLSGLSDLTNIIGGLEIIDNPALEICNIHPVCTYVSNNPNTSEIANNSTNCQSKNTVLGLCDNLGKVYHPIFIDFNDNGIMDGTDVFSTFASVVINPGNIISYGNNTNGGQAYLTNGEYTVSYNQASTPDFELTTTPASYTITIDNTNPEIDTIYFGLHPTIDYSAMESYIHSVNFRCNELTELNIFGQNMGYSITSGTLWFHFDEDFPLDYQFVDTPDTLVLPDKVGWHFENLAPEQKVHKRIKIQIPGPPEFTLGEYLNFASQVQFIDSFGEFTTEEFIYSHVVRCAFDPNDKLVAPTYPENYSLIDENLIYTIRFQNTGNAEALQVVIRDTLDNNLDPNTFRYLASSHEEVLTTSLADNQFLAFSFDNINLPDSTSNFKGSQGFVMYTIRNIETIEEGTNIQNTAGIYFDYNPPVITNTTENILLETFDADGDGFEFWIDCDDTYPEINPDAEEIANNDIDENCDGIALIIDEDMDGFNSDEDCDDQNSAINSDAEEIANNEIDENCDGEILLLSNNNLTLQEPKIIPNPTSNFIQIILQDHNKSEMEIRTTTGKLINQKIISNNEEVDLSSYTSGIYLITIRTAGKVWVKRVVKI